MVISLHKNGPAPIKHMLIYSGGCTWAMTYPFCDIPPPVNGVGFPAHFVNDLLCDLKVAVSLGLNGKMQLS
jgi:hypothetical protein